MNEYKFDERLRRGMQNIQPQGASWIERSFFRGFFTNAEHTLKYAKARRGALQVGIDLGDPCVSFDFAE